MTSIQEQDPLLNGKKLPQTIKPHFYPESLERAADYKVTVNGVALDVLSHPAANHTSFESEGPVHVEVIVPDLEGNVTVRPLKLNIAHQIQNDIVSFTLNTPQNIQVEIEGKPLLYIYALPPEPAIGEGKKARFFEGGKIHDVGQLVLEDGETCWIDAGAVVRGSIVTSDCSGIHIGGYGILDGSYWLKNGNTLRKSIILNRCNKSLVENILMLGPSSWMVVLGECNDIVVSGIRQLAVDYSSDGIDIVASKRIIVKGCCLHNGDDNIALKSLSQGNKAEYKWTGDVEDILVSNCIFYNINGGTAMEIGYETSTEHIQNVRFENCDVLAVHQFGSVFGIHNGDRAYVNHITYDNIRVEHHYDTLVDIRNVKSRWNHDAERGLVSNILLRNINVFQSEHNKGYTVSIISGYDANHPVCGVRFQNFRFNGLHITNPDMLDLVTRHVSDIIFC